MLIKSLLLAASAAALTSTAASAVTQSFDVDAELYTWTSGSSGLMTGITLMAGDTFSTDVSLSASWLVCTLNEEFCRVDADGNRTSGSGDFGIYTAEGFSAMTGSLVGRLGTGAFFEIGSDVKNLVAGNDGELSLFMWDGGNTSNNSEAITVSVTYATAPIPLPAGGVLLVTGLIGLGGIRRFANRERT